MVNLSMNLFGRQKFGKFIHQNFKYIMDIRFLQLVNKVRIRQTLVPPSFHRLRYISSYSSGYSTMVTLPTPDPDPDPV